MSVSSDKIDALVKSAVFDPDEKVREKSRQEIRDIAASAGVFPASIQGLYEASGKGLYNNKAVPAINIRGITYLVARAVFRSALKDKVGALIFEIARSEIGYTAQRPGEYAACVLAAAVREGFRGPVCIQGDHYQVNQKKYSADPAKEIDTIKDLIRESVEAGFYNIDIDASTLVDIEAPNLDKEQEKNYSVTAELTEFIRSIEPKGVTISVGGEIGEVGKQNSTVEDLKAFMTGYRKVLNPKLKGISKISVQTGSTHGGVVLPDGSIADVKLDFETLEKLSKAAKEEYGMGGAVQHGASTLPDEAFHMFPEVGTVEVHLATGFQNIIYDSVSFPKDLSNRINKHVLENYAGERKQGQTDEQFIYTTRKKALGDFKKEIWSIPEENLTKIGQELEDRFTLLFNKLNVVDTVDLVKKHVG